MITPVEDAATADAKDRYGPDYAWVGPAPIQDPARVIHGKLRDALKGPHGLAHHDGVTAVCIDTDDDEAREIITNILEGKA